MPKFEIVIGVILVLLVGFMVVSHCEQLGVCPQSDDANNKSCQVVKQSGGRIFVVFDVKQRLDLVKDTSFNEPAQFAIWLENPETHNFKTIFVTYRSATGDLVGKAECPGCLPLWFSVYEREKNELGLPTPSNPAPAAVTVATPLTESFQLKYEIERGSRWIFWMEVNLAGDFNERYQEYNEADESIDWDFSGQPPVVWRCEIEAIPGRIFVPELYGIVNIDKPFEEMIEPLNEDVTTAREVFNSIKISIVEGGS